MRHLLAVFILFSVLFVSLSGQCGQPILSQKSAELQLQQAEEDLNKGKLDQAGNIVYYLRPLLSDMTEMHSKLYNALKDDQKAVDTAKQERLATIEFAKLRDRANYLAGLISEKQGNQLEAVKHFVLVVESQRTTELGKLAYIELKKLGFSPYLTIDE